MELLGRRVQIHKMCVPALLLWGMGLGVPHLTGAMDVARRPFWGAGPMVAGGRRRRRAPVIALSRRKPILEAIRVFFSKNLAHYMIKH